MLEFQSIAEVRIGVVADPWRVDPDFVAEADRLWAVRTAANPHLWDGRIYGVAAPGWPGGVAIEDGVLTATASEGRFSVFLAWRDAGFPEIGLRNLFGSALIQSAEGALVYGVMGRHTANAGKIYPPGGSLDPQDLTADGRLDVVASIGRELAEETGLAAEAGEERGLFAAVDGPRISVGRLIRFPLSTDELLARIRRNLDAQSDRELEDVVAVRSAADAADPRFPGYARSFAARLTGVS